MCDIIENVIINNFRSTTIECLGPEELSFKEIIKKLIKSLEIKRVF